MHGPMDLDHGKPNAKDALLAGSFTLAATLVAAIGLMLIAWSQPKFDEQWNAFRVIGTLTGVAVAFRAFVFSERMFKLTISLWSDYRDRLADWHEAELNAYQAMNGQEQITEVSQFELSPNVPYQFLITALVIHHQLQQAQRLSLRLDYAPYSIRGLEKGLWLGNDRSNSIFIGEFRGTKPERVSEQLAAMGFVADRQPGYAGRWVPQTTDEIFDQFIRNWHKTAEVNR
jgi:hypothetical protein